MVDWIQLYQIYLNFASLSLTENCPSYYENWPKRIAKVWPGRKGVRSADLGIFWVLKEIPLKDFLIPPPLRAPVNRSYYTDCILLPYTKKRDGAIGGES